MNMCSGMIWLMGMGRISAWLIGELFPGISQGFPVLPQKSHSMDCLLSEMALLRKAFGVK